MKFTYAVGCDVGKLSFHYCILKPSGQRIYESMMNNDQDSIQGFIEQIKSLLSLDSLSDCLLCMEYTGIYTNWLAQLWLAQGGQLSIVPAQKISSLIAGDQGWDEKNDCLDARRIAEYCIRFSDKLRPYQLKKRSLEQIELLQRQRQRLLNAVNMLEIPVKEAKGFVEDQQVDLLKEHQNESVKALRADIKKIEQQLKVIIEQDEELSILFEQISSVQGVGPVTAREILIATQGFTKFKPNQAKAFARYAGVTPREWSSGKSVRKRSPRSKRANQRIKALLTQGARSVAATNGELGIYYQRKRAEGKPFLSVINALRNKIILRVFAVVRNQVMYEKNLNICLD